MSTKRREDNAFKVACQGAAIGDFAQWGLTPLPGRPELRRPACVLAFVR